MHHLDGILLNRMQKQFNFSEQEVIEYWSLEWDHHHQNIRNFFKDKDTFIEFNIDTDPISKLIDFVSPEYQLNPKHWLNLNKTESYP